MAAMILDLWKRNQMYFELYVSTLQQRNLLKLKLELYSSNYLSIYFIFDILAIVLYS